MILHYCLLTLLVSFFYTDIFTQFKVTIPSGIPLTVDFGNGSTNPGRPLQFGYSDFKYKNGGCPLPGEYAIVNNDICFNNASNDAGHIYFGTHPLQSDTGYMMIVNYQPSAVPKIIFSDTLKNLCSNNQYLFWAAIKNLVNPACFNADLSFVAETVSGQLIQSFQTGDIGGANDNYHPYFGYTGYDMTSVFQHFYGGTFTVPAGTNNVVVKLIIEPSVVHSCPAGLAIDNIQVMPVGPSVSIQYPGDDAAWLISACYKGNKPLVLSGDLDSAYLDFSTQQLIKTRFINSAVQWQQSLDEGYTWIDIPGETNLALSKKFSNPDTFYIRLRASEDYNIKNPNCSVISNIIQANVDSEPKDFDITSNSPVCEDSDIVFKLSGGSTYTTTGPNNFYDPSPSPHVYHPVLADSGWYKTQITTQGGCIAEDSTFVKVIGPNLTTSIPQDSVCYGKSVQLNATGASKYVWTPSDFLSNPNIANPVAYPLSTTKYQVQATDTFGCSAFNSVIVHIKDSVLHANFISENILCPNDIPSFTDTSIGAVTKWFWSFGNGETNAQKTPLSPHYTSNINKTYLVQLIVWDDGGCSDTIIKLIKTVTNCYIAVPSAFTPNNDGLNDYLYPLNAYKATNLYFKIFNRFGELVFQTKDWTKKWDGKSNSIPQPTGTYAWILNYVDADNRQVSLKGTTTLIR